MITANAVHPGAIFETNLSRHMSPDVLERVWTQVRERQALPPEFSPEAASGVAPYALDPDKAVRLWELSEQMITTAR